MAEGRCNEPIYPWGACSRRATEPSGRCWQHDPKRKRDQERKREERRQAEREDRQAEARLRTQAQRRREAALLLDEHYRDCEGVNSLITLLRRNADEIAALIQ